MNQTNKQDNSNFHQIKTKFQGLSGCMRGNYTLETKLNQKY